MKHAENELPITNSTVPVLFNKQGVDWASPTTLVIIILGILLGLLLLYGLYTKLGGLGP